MKDCYKIYGTCDTANIQDPMTATTFSEACQKGLDYLLEKPVKKYGHHKGEPVVCVDIYGPNHSSHDILGTSSLAYHAGKPKEA